MGGVMGSLGVGFTRTLDFFEDIFEAMKIRSVFKPAVGGLLLGGIAIFYPQVLADGYETISLTLHGQMWVGLLILLIFLKMIATSLTLGSGNSGGIFAPSLFMGAVAGGAFGVAMNYLFPGVTASPGAYALVGMAGMVAATTHAPITAMLIIFEMTSDYRIILPLMVNVVFSALVAGRLFKHSIYTAKLARQGIDIRGGKDVNVLRSHKVSEIMERDFETIPANLSLHDIIHKFEHTTESYFVVLDRQGLLLGVISFQDIRSLITQHSCDYLVIAQDVVRPNSVVVRADDTLERANELIGVKDLRLLPVVDPVNDRQVLGVLRREEMMRYYNRQLIDTLRR
jgi:CIC family chloride channel protein